MAHYAFLDKNNIVTEVIVGKNEKEDNINWEQYYGEFRGQTCKRTSYNTAGGVHSGGGVPFRLNYAGIGYVFREDINVPEGAFIPPCTGDEYVLDESTGLWTIPNHKDII
jgi:hypothetical protein